ncbi:type II secretion system protein GspH [Stutzerimonas balearica]|jgi:general secretion pathway protein H|uniref:type II secretion system minor pseudopilin GspH n=1 Tax=Stutzerimonas balearica TaxID=74829 RepID=UPI000773B30F|nr:type II secretion system minor pseudopilin GspH [Stutzerimonas balearica]OMG64930.1 type II secretion system protein GspH [Stutzerimonas balearica]WAN09662.1 type II secretion system minor pseudopilin GspH [Stutzerimonas balearica]
MRRRARAFTLIELLVVLVLLGILVGLAVLASGSSSSSRELRDEARRLAALIGVLSDEAVLDSREYGLLVSDAGYRVLRLDEATGRWDEPDRSRGRQLPEWMRLQLELDGTPLRLLDPARSESDRAGLSREDQAPRRSKRRPRLEPQLLILSSGELSPFTLRLSERRADGNAWRLSSDGLRLPQAEPLESRR